MFFRDTCRREAVGRGVAGWIRNRADGAVEAAFEGPEDAVAAMCSWCESGPPHATVDHVEVTTEEPRGESDFHVRP